jgi:Plus-3 domain
VCVPKLQRNRFNILRNLQLRYEQQNAQQQQQQLLTHSASDKSRRKRPVSSSLTTKSRQTRNANEDDYLNESDDVEDNLQNNDEYHESSQTRYKRLRRGKFIQGNSVDGDDDNNRCRVNKGSASTDEDGEGFDSASATALPPTLEDIHRAQLLRNHVRDWAFAHFFENLAVGAFVRCSMSSRDNANAAYTLCRITHVQDASQPYEIEGRVMKHVFGIEHGTNRHTTTAIYISNAFATEAEYVEWQEKHKQAINVSKSTPSKNYGLDLAKPHMLTSFLQRKAAEFDLAKAHKFTDNEIIVMAQQKQELNMCPRTIAERKAELMRIRNHALRLNQPDEAQAAELELQKLGPVTQSKSTDTNTTGSRSTVPIRTEKQKTPTTGRRTGRPATSSTTVFVSRILGILERNGMPLPDPSVWAASQDGSIPVPVTESRKITSISQSRSSV